MKRESFIALFLLSCVFFFWGFLTAINTILVPYAKEVFELTNSQSMLIQTVFFSTPLIVCLPTVRLIRKVGYKRSLICGLALISCGALCVVPALYSESFVNLLGSILVIASGVAMLQVVANPYVVAIGDIDTAPQRLTIASTINSLGTTVGPYVGAYALFGSSSVTLATMMYISVASLIALVILIISMVRMAEPAISRMSEEVDQRIFDHSNLVFGILAIFLYTGAETSVGTFLVSYLTSYTDYSPMEAAKMVSLYWGGAMIGRIAGSLTFGRISPRKILRLNAVFAIGVMLSALFYPGKVTALALVSMGLLNSIMYPVIFSLAVSKVGNLKERASGLLIMAGVGGATIPLAQSSLIDRIGLTTSFIIPMTCYCFIFVYAFSLYKTKLEVGGIVKVSRF